MKKILAFLLSCVIISTTGITFAVNAEEISEDMSAYDDTNATDDLEPGMTGLQPMTEEELKIKEENLILSEKANINDIALDRINENLEAENQSEVYLQTAELGEETVTNESEDSGISAQSVEGISSLLSKVDNTTDERTKKYFPKAGNQGSQGSCGAFASTYYLMTYMNALANDYDVQSDDNYILSPKFTYNIGRSGSSADYGIWPSTAYTIVKKHGCPFNCDFEYTSYPTDATDYLEWPTTAEVWESALENRVKDCGWGYIGDESDETPVTSPDDENLELIKTYLANGYVLNIATWKNSWKTVDMEDGSELCVEVTGSEGFHAMTVVGYDDTIYYDINGDKVEDPGEFGAFKIINSWGANNQYETWFAYDALNAVSSVTGETRHQGWHANEFTWATMYKDYTPKLTAEFEVTTNARNGIYLTLGSGTTSDTAPTATWTPFILNGTGWAYGIDGTTDSNTAEIVLDYSELIDDNDLNSNNYKQRWFLSTSNSAIAINGFTAEDIPFGDTYSCTDTLSGDNKNIYVDAQLPLKVAKNKVWTLSFNYPLNSSTVNSNTVYVKDASGTSFPVTLTMPNTKSITVTGTKNYVSGTYYKLTVNGVKTLGGNSLGSAVNKKFVIE